MKRGARLGEIALRQKLGFAVSIGSITKLQI
jgi:hypothetical protein